MTGNILNSEFAPKVLFTEYGGHAIELAREAIKDQYEIIVAAGGDGTINEVASVLINTDIILGLLPLGSGNGLARFLKIPLNTIASIRLYNHFTVRTVDAVTVNDHFFTSIAGVGLDAEVAHSFQNNRMRGLLEYSRITLTALSELKTKDYSLILDGKEIQQSAVMISIANSNQFGFNMRIAPEARIDDGLLDVCIVKKGSFTNMINVGYNALAGIKDESGLIDYYKAKEVIVKNSGQIKVNIDGEAALFNSDLHFKIMPACLKVAVPLRSIKNLN